ncbi:hypothetical protein A3Q56_07362 [Intoshia linei]|uniref:IRS-type PTB domain-containing protein n=1 Tax=Intoshia linei TaxID=1819745 RepID=A0A177ASD6_9BILA|nr:hypothetical protein A3Q56_07362 [Intoshia linei]
MSELMKRFSQKKQTSKEYGIIHNKKWFNVNLIMSCKRADSHFDVVSRKKPTHLRGKLILDKNELVFEKNDVKLTTWAYKHIRRYGKTYKEVSILTGSKYCAGVGYYIFGCKHSETLYNAIFESMFICYNNQKSRKLDSQFIVSELVNETENFKNINLDENKKKLFERRNVHISNLKLPNTFKNKFEQLSSIPQTSNSGLLSLHNLSFKCSNEINSSILKSNYNTEENSNFISSDCIYVRNLSNSNLCRTNSELNYKHVDVTKTIALSKAVKFAENDFIKRHNIDKSN